MSLSTMLFNLKLNASIFDPFAVDASPVLKQDHPATAMKLDDAVLTNPRTSLSATYCLEDGHAAVTVQQVELNGHIVMNNKCINCKSYFKSEDLSGDGSFHCKRTGESFDCHRGAMTCELFERREPEDGDVIDPMLVQFAQ